MEEFIRLFQQSGFAHIEWGNWVMFVIAGIFIYLAISKEFEPLLLIPIGFGILQMEANSILEWVKHLDILLTRWMVII